MAEPILTRKVDRNLGRFLAVHQVELSQPRDRMLQMNAVPTGPRFNKRCTNVLLRERPTGSVWQVYVDEDLAYQGDDPARRALFGGTPRRGWLELASPEPVAGDVNGAILWSLDQLESALAHLAPEALKGALSEIGQQGTEPMLGEKASQKQQPLDPVLERVGRRLDLARLAPADFEPTSAQSDCIRRVAETACRRAAPNAPLLVGPAGGGKTTVARLAAGELVRRGLAEQVIEIQGAAVAAGAIFWPERDERLRQTLEALLTAGPAVAVVEQFDLVLAKSDVACALVADALDRGLMLIAVARPDFSRRQLKSQSPLRRRLEPTALRRPTRDELAAILRRRLAGHPLASEVELAPAVLPLVASLAAGRPGANPGAALGLLEAVLNRAAFADQRCIGPDDVYHLAPPKKPR